MSVAVCWSGRSSRRRWSPRLPALLLAVLFLAGCPAGPPPDKPATLRLTFLDVGQGDATVIESPSGRVAVIDGGGRPGADERTGDDPGARVVVPFLRRRGVRAVDLLIATHADDDHAQGLIAVASRLPVRAALVSGFAAGGAGEGAAASHDRLLARLRERRVPVREAVRGQTIDLGSGVRLEVLNPPRPHLRGGRSDGNDNSIVLRVVYGRARLLLTGDAEAAAESDLLRRVGGGRLKADLLKVGHHGSRFSTGEEFLNAVDPGVSVVSAGRDNVYGHPHSEVISRLNRRNIRLFRTDRHGAVTVETDGRTLRVTPTLVPEGEKKQRPPGR